MLRGCCIAMSADPMLDIHDCDVVENDVNTDAVNQYASYKLKRQ